MGKKGSKEEENGENRMMRNFVICAAEQILYVLSNQGRWAGHVARMWENTNAYSVLVGKNW